MGSVIEIKNLVKRYKDLVALDHLNMTIKEGEIFGLLGPNGSGKTTAINCILSLLKYDKGEITVFGEEMKPTSYNIKKDIGVVLQNVAVFEKMNVIENIDYFCGLYIKDKKERAKCVKDTIAFVGLEDFTKMKPKQLSGGLLRRLNIACGIAHKPKLIFMDEPTVAVDPQSRNQILEGIKKLNAQGSTVIYTSHYMEEVEQICTRIAILDKGHCIAIGSKEELKNMINIGEKVTAEAIVLTEEQIKEIKEIKDVIEVTYEDEILHVNSKKPTQNITNVLDYLNKNQITFGKFYSELPTLNDVFLELTGTELRD